LPGGEAARNLLPLLADKKPLVRREAAYALGAVRNPNAVNSLLQTAQKDKVAEVRNAAIVALGEIGDAAAVGELVKVFTKKNRSRKKNLRAVQRRVPSGKSRKLSKATSCKFSRPKIFCSDDIKQSANRIIRNCLMIFPCFVRQSAS
jgi:hypothetical protein